MQRNKKGYMLCYKYVVMSDILKLREVLICSVGPELQLNMI